MELISSKDIKNVELTTYLKKDDKYVEEDYLRVTAYNMTHHHEGFNDAWYHATSDVKYAELINFVVLLLTQRGRYNCDDPHTKHKYVFSVKLNNGEKINFEGFGYLNNNPYLKNIANCLFFMIPDGENFTPFINPILSKCKIIPLTQDNINKYKNARFVYYAESAYGGLEFMTDDYVMLRGESDLENLDIRKLFKFTKSEFDMNNKNLIFPTFVNDELWYEIALGGQSDTMLLMSHDFFEIYKEKFSNKNVALRYGNWSRIFGRQRY